MPAYMIVFAKINDRDAFLQGYAPAATRLVEKFGGKYLVRAQGAEVLEGSLEPGVSVVISEWPDRETIKRFWDSREYAQAKALREGVADVNVLIVDQLPADYSNDKK
jgi:uncharacterized protein (DUF1330 family)